MAWKGILEAVRTYLLKMAKIRMDGRIRCKRGGEDVGGTSASVAQGQRNDRHQVLAIAGVQFHAAYN